MKSHKTHKTVTTQTYFYSVTNRCALTSEFTKLNFFQQDHTYIRNLYIYSYSIIVILPHSNSLLSFNIEEKKPSYYISIISMCGEVWAKSVYYVILFLCAKLHHVQADAKMPCVSTNLRTAQSLI